MATDHITLDGDDWPANPYAEMPDAPLVRLSLSLSNTVDTLLVSLGLDIGADELAAELCSYLRGYIRTRVAENHRPPTIAMRTDALAAFRRLAEECTDNFTREVPAWLHASP